MTSPEFFYEHDVGTINEGTLDCSSITALPEISPTSTRDAEAFREAQRSDEAAFETCKFTQGGLSWSHGRSRYLARAKAGAGGRHEDMSLTLSASEAALTVAQPVDDLPKDGVDMYLVEKLNPESRSHALPLVKDIRGELRYRLKSLPEFEKFQDLFYEKSQERNNHTGGIMLYEPVIDRDRSARVESDSAAVSTSKVEHNILQSCVLSAIRKSAIERSPKEIKYITDWLSNIDFLRNLSLKLRVDLSAVLEFERVDGQQYVFEMGDVVTDSDGFYVLFKGTAKVIVKDYVTGEPKVVRTIKKDESFGELALFSAQARTASIMTQEASQFVKIRTADFLRVMSTQNEVEAMQKRQLLRHISLLAECSDEVIQNISMFMFARTCDENQVIAREGEDCTSLYILASGEVQLRQDVEVVKSMGGGDSGTNIESEAKSIVVNLLKPGQIFGETMLMSGKGNEAKWATSAVTSSPVRMFVISKSEFLHAFSFAGTTEKTDKSVVEAMREMTAFQKYMRDWKFQHIQKTLKETHENIVHIARIWPPNRKLGHAASEYKKRVGHRVRSSTAGAGGKATRTAGGRSGAGASPARSRSSSRGGSAEPHYKGGGGEPARARAKVKSMAKAAGTAGQVLRDARGSFMIDMCSDRRRRLAERAAALLEQGHQDSEKVKMTKFLVGGEDRARRGARRRAGTGGGGRGGAVQAERSFSYSMAVEAEEDYS